MLGPVSDARLLFLDTNYLCYGFVFVLFCGSGEYFLTASLAQGEQSLEYLCGEIVAVIEFFFVA